MVKYKPYVYWKINNVMTDYTTVDNNYLWATVVESKKGPINTPVLCANSAEVMSIFGVDMQAYFSQGAEFLVVVRAAAENNEKKLGIAKADITISEDFVYSKVANPIYTETGLPKKYVLDTNGIDKIYVTPKVGEPSVYVKCDPTTGIIDTTATEEYTTDILDETDKVAENITIPAGTPVINLEAIFPGEYDLKLILYKNLTHEGYNLTLTEENNGYISINNETNLLNIINRINDGNLNVKASLTEKGAEIDSIIKSTPVASNPPYTDVAAGQILAPAGADKYMVKLTELDNSFAFIGGSNGDWDDVNNRISADSQANAHKEALAALRMVRVAGIFCFYGEDNIQREYLLHVNNPADEYAGMNSNMVCRWRYIILGANEDDIQTMYSLKQKAQSINDQYVLFIGQGLIDGGKVLKPYECTPYLAGLRARLNYGDAIFGGQSKKEIKGVYSDLMIAPLFAYEDTLVWEPLAYAELNEAGVLTFTTEYGKLTFVDGVTTAQDNSQQSEESVVNILKYIQNGVQSLCIRYIGRNINSDLQASLEMSITGFLEKMVSTDQTLIELPDENIKPYEVEVVMNPRSTQVVGKIYVYLKVTPVHALRQIEVQMTVQ